MMRTFWFLALGLGLAIGTVWAGQGTAQTGTVQAGGDIFHNAEQGIVLILVGDGGGRVQTASTGVVIRSDGIVLTTYRPLKGAQEVQVRLKDGEVYDQVYLLGFDERRNVAALHIPATGVASLSGAALEQAMAGDKIHVLNAEGANAWSSSEGVLGPVRLADEVVGAGHGYRIIQFMAPLPPSALGAALLNSRGQLLGIVTGPQNTSGQQYAVPAESVTGLPGQWLHLALGTGKNLTPPAVIPNQGPAPDEPATPIAVLAKARTLRVTTKTMSFTPFMLEKELLNNTEFRTLGINVLDNSQAQGLLVNVDRPVFTYDFTYSVTDSHTGIVLATGKVTAIDGPHAAQGIARKLVQELEKARAVQAVNASPQEMLSAQQ